MGQPITVVRKPSSKPGVARFEINRSLTGMGHEHYRSAADAATDRPPDELARRLFAKGGVKAIHVYSNVVTVELEPNGDAKGFEDVIRELYIHYRPGVTPSFSG